MRKILGTLTAVFLVSATAFGQVEVGGGTFREELNPLRSGTSQMNLGIDQPKDPFGQITTYGWITITEIFCRPSVRSLSANSTGRLFAAVQRQ